MKASTKNTDLKSIQSDHHRSIMKSVRDFGGLTPLALNSIIDYVASLEDSVKKAGVRVAGYEHVFPGHSNREA